MTNKFDAAYKLIDEIQERVENEGFYEYSETFKVISEALTIASKIHENPYGMVIEQEPFESPKCIYGSDKCKVCK